MTAKPSMNDVAREAGVSKNTVSLAMRHSPQIPARTRERILRIARRLGYSKNPTVACLMAELRRSGRREFQAGLALINANLDPRAFLRHPTIPAYVSGCRRRAAELGYSVDEFWLHDPQWSGRSLARALRTRNLRGIVLAGLMHDNRLPDAYRELWEEFPAVVAGVRTQNPTLPFASSDHHMLLDGAVEECLRAGYRRPGFVLDAHIDLLLEGRLSAGFASAQRRLKTRDRLPVFTFDPVSPERRPAFLKWFQKWMPDALLCLYTEVTEWLGQRRGIGLVQLEWRASQPDWAGMDQHNDITGEAAIDMLANMIQNGYQGVPDFPRATLIGSTWRPGPSLPPGGRAAL